jgi:hypothetical protein
MSIREEIFEEFLKELERTEGFPPIIIDRLRAALKGGEHLSEEKIIEIVGSAVNADKS